jgi:hypothetical protein
MCTALSFKVLRNGAESEFRSPLLRPPVYSRSFVPPEFRTVGTKVGYSMLVVKKMWSNARIDSGVTLLFVSVQRWQAYENSFVF